MKATDFYYDGHRLSEFGFTICEFDGGSGMEVLEAGVPLTFRTVSRKKGRIHSLVDLRYESALEATIDICKDPCTFDNEMEITDAEYLLLCRWLLTDSFRDLVFTDTEEAASSAMPRRYRAMINISKIIISDGFYGLRLNVTTDKPYAYGPDIVYNLDFSNSLSGVIDDTSPLTGITVPDLEISCFEDGDLKVTNSTLGSSFQVKNCVFGEVITVDGSNLVVTSNNPDHALWEDFDYEFLKVGNTFSNTINNINATIRCSIKLTIKPIIRDVPGDVPSYYIR